MRRPLLLLTLLPLLPGTGCYASGEAPPPALAAGDLACPPSELALAWSHAGAPLDGSFHPVSLELAPGDALLVRRSAYARGDALRASDGARIASLVSAPHTDAAWSRTVETDEATRVVTVREIRSGAVLASIAGAALGEGWYGRTVAQLDESGSRVLVLDCDQRGEEVRTSLRRVDLATSSEQRVELPMGCADAWPGRLALRELGADAVLIAGARPAGPTWGPHGPVPANELVRVDLASGEVTRVAAVSAERAALDPSGPDLPFEILDVALSEDRGTIAITGRDGWLRRFDARTLAELGTPIEVGVHVANPISYLPSIESPLAISRGGAWLAHLDREGAIVIRDASSAIAVRLESPFSGTDESPFGPPATMALRFADDGLVLASSAGVARFACGGAAAEAARPAGALSVRLEGPGVVRSGERARFAIDVEGESLPAIRGVRIGEAELAIGALGRDVETWTYELGAHVVEAIADDGVRRASARASVEVLAAD